MLVMMMMMIEAEERRRDRHDGQVLLYYARNTSPINQHVYWRCTSVCASGAPGADGQCLLVW
jgi:hypothetical protein